MARLIHLATTVCAATLAVTACPPAGAATSPVLPPGTTSTRAIDPAAIAAAPRTPLPRDLRAALRTALQRVVHDGAMGSEALVEAPGQRLSATAGARAAGTKAAPGPNAAFRVASNTKTMIATLVMQQVERGTWTLQTTVGQAWPGLLPGHEQVTLEQLLSHTSGMPDGIGVALAGHLKGQDWPAVVAALRERYTDAELVRAGLSLPWGQAGTFSYSNTGYVVLGMLLQRSTGQTLPDLLRTRVLRPAGMTHTTFATAPGMPARALADTAKTVNPRATFDLTDTHPSLFSSAGAVISTPLDMNRFTKALMTGKLVNRSTLLQMERPRSAGPLNYGLGMYRVPDQCAAPGSGRFLSGHDGASFGTFSFVFASPDGTRRFAVATTGRYLDRAPGKQPFDLAPVLLTALRATCPTH